MEALKSKRPPSLLKVVVFVVVVVARLTHATQLSEPEVKELFSDRDRTGFAVSC